MYNTPPISNIPMPDIKLIAHAGTALPSTKQKYLTVQFYLAGNCFFLITRKKDGIVMTKTD